MKWLYFPQSCTQLQPLSPNGSSPNQRVLWEISFRTKIVASLGWNSLPNYLVYCGSCSSGRLPTSCMFCWVVEQHMVCKSHAVLSSVSANISIWCLFVKVQRQSNLISLFWLVGIPSTFCKTIQIVLAGFFQLMTTLVVIRFLIQYWLIQAWEGAEDRGLSICLGAMLGMKEPSTLPAAQDCHDVWPGLPAALH